MPPMRVSETRSYTAFTWVGSVSGIANVDRCRVTKVGDIVGLHLWRARGSNENAKQEKQKPAAKIGMQGKIEMQQ